MEKIDILLTVMVAGFGVTFAMMRLMWNETKDIRSDIHGIGKDISNLSERVARIEGILSTKESCVLKDDRIRKEAQ